VVPVSDPNIFSEAQRFAQVQAVAQRAAALPQMYDARKVEERLLETLKVPNWKELLTPPMQPREQNAVNENVAATLGRPINAFPEQDHLAHIETHISYLQSPMLGGSMLIAPQFIPIVMGHLKEHIALWYAATVVEMSNTVLGEDIGDLMDTMGTDPEERRSLDRMLAQAGAAAAQQSTQLFAKLPPIIQQAQELMKQFAPQPIQDPRVALEGQKLQQQAQRDQQQMQIEGAKLQASQAEQQMQAQRDQQQMQLEAQRLQLQQVDQQQDNQLDAAELQVRLQIEQQRQMAEDARKAADLEARLSMNDSDNATAMQLAAAEISSGERVAFSTGTGINPNPNQ